MTEGTLPLITYVDLASGTVEGPFDLGGSHTDWLHAIVADQDAVWLRSNEYLQRFEPATATVTTLATKGLGLSSGGGGIWTVAPTDARLVCKALPFIAGVAFEDVRLDGAFPRTSVVVLFRADSHPGVLFGRCERLWADDGALEGAYDLATNLMEDVTACGHGLPADPAVDDSGTAWV